MAPAPHRVKRPRISNDIKRPQLLPDVVDQLCADRPSETWISIPKSKDPSTGFRDVTYKELSNAVNAATTWLQNSVQTDQPCTLPYLGPTDTRYIILVVAAIKAGHHLFLISPRNEDRTQLKLLEAVGYRHFLCAATEASYVSNLLAKTEFAIEPRVLLVVPEESTLLASTDNHPRASGKEFHDLRYETAIVMHTSGTSSSSPKLINLTHGYLACEDILSLYPPQDGSLTLNYTLFQNNPRCFHGTPFYHAGGVLFGLLKGLFQRTVFVLGPPGITLNAELTDSCLKHGRCNSLQTVPSLLEDLIRNGSSSQTLARLDWIWFGGGPISKSAGEALMAINKHAVHGYGMTEIGLLPILPLPDPVENWEYQYFHPSSGATFESSSEGNDRYELIIQRVQLTGVEPHQSCFELNLKLNSFHTGDIWSRHPHDKRLWKYDGRADDLVVLSTGEKFDPNTVEQLICESGLVSAALVVGGQSRPILALELRHRETPTTVLTQIRALVQRANETLPVYGKITTSSILVAKNKFLRTQKGTIRRHATVEALQPEIRSFLIHDQDPESDIESIISQQVREIVIKKIGPVNKASDDLFRLGLDSIGVARIVRSVNKKLREQYADGKGAPQISAKHVYRHGTVESLSKVVTERIKRFQAGSEKPLTWEENSKRILQRHLSADRSDISHLSVNNRISEKKVAILTGSTGSLGTHLLHQLIHDPAFDQVICLDRSSKGRTSYVEAFPTDIPNLECQPEKVQFYCVHTVDILKPGIIPVPVLKTILSSCRAIIHNAWPIQSHLPLSASTGNTDQTSNEIDTETDWDKSMSYEPHLAGLQALIKLVSICPTRPKLVFVSSLAAALNLNPIPEQIVDNPNAPDTTEYARSKWLGEILLNEAVFGQQSLPNGSKHPTKGQLLAVRIGQIAGPLPQFKESLGTGTGSWWNRNEVIPSLIRSSAVIGVLPDYLFEKDKLRWTPVNACAHYIMDILRHKMAKTIQSSPDRTSIEVYNISNIHSSVGGQQDLQWSGPSGLVNSLRSHLEAKISKAVDIIPLSDWIQKVDEFGVRENNPAIKLMDFYEKILCSDANGGLSADIIMTDTKEASPAIRDLEPVRWEWVEKWLSDWGL